MTPTTALQALNEVSKIARHPDYEWPLDLARQIDAIIARAALSAPAQDAQADLIGDCVASECAARTPAPAPAPAPVDAAATVPGFDMSCIDSPFNACMHKDYCLSLKAATPPAAPQEPCGGRENCGRFPFCGCGDDALPERDTSKPAEQQGLFRKFEVRRTDGSDLPGGKHHGCEYFVLDTDHDPAAKPALAAYADAIEATHKPLADDMRARYGLDAAPQAVLLTDAQATAGQGRLPCGHEQALLIRSAQTGEPLYCEACDDKSGRADAEAMEQELREKLDAATLKPQAPALVPLTGHHKLDNDQQVFFYEQDFYILSNFSSFALRWNGLDFPTSEHAYHWEKFNMRGERQAECRNRIHGARSAHDAFKVASELKPFRRADWDDVKVGIMRDILRTKANQHEYVRRKLLATGDRELVEDSWRDDYWGWGPNRDGQNMLGKLWMEVRAELKAGITPTTKEQQ